MGVIFGTLNKVIISSLLFFALFSGSLPFFYEAHNSRRRIQWVSNINVVRTTSGYKLHYVMPCSLITLSVWFYDYLTNGFRNSDTSSRTWESCLHVHIDPDDSNPLGHTIRF